MPYTYIPNLKVLVPRDASREAESLWVNERADHVNTPVAGKAEIWVKNDANQTLMVTDDAGVDRTVADSSGTGSVNATYYDERADHVNTPTAGKAELWVKNAAQQALYLTDDAGVDHGVPLYLNGVPGNNAILVGYNSDGRIDGSTLFAYNSSNGQQTMGQVAGSSIRMLEAAAIAAGAPAANYGAIWVKNTAPNTLIYTDDTGADQSLQPMYGLGQWSFGNSTLGVTTSGTFDTDNATLALITAIRFSSTPQAGTGQAITSWGDKLPQTGILYFRDVSDPGGTSVTFPYTSLTFPLGTIAPQFNGVALSTDGTVLGTNWSANNYVVTLVPSSTTLDGAGAPGVATGNGYPLGTVYADTTADAGYILVDNSAGANVWSIQGDVAGPATSTDNAVAKFDSTTGKIIQNSNVLVADSGSLTLSGTTDPMISMEERAVAPTGSAGKGRWFVRTDGANTALPEQTPWFTNDSSLDIRLGMQSVSISGEVSPSVGSTWYSWGSAGPYNDTLWSDAVGTLAAPTTSNWFTRPPLILIPGDANIERVVGWYQSESATVGTWEMELVAVAIEDSDTTVGTVDVIVDGSVNADFSVTDAKITLLSHTINDRTALPTDTSHMTGLYMAFQETTGTALNVDLRFGVTIYWSTYSIDGWVSDGFAAS